MSELAIFNFEQLPVRVVTMDGEPWFVAVDVCKILEVKNVSDAISRLDDDEVQVIDYSTVATNDGRENQTVSNFDPKTINLINESGLYALTLTSRKPEAKRFKKWLTSEVLPQLRKTGHYALQSQNSLEIMGWLERTFTSIQAQQQEMFSLIHTQQQELTETKQEIKEIKDELKTLKLTGGWMAYLYHQLSANYWDLQKLHDELDIASEEVRVLYRELRHWRDEDLVEKESIKQAEIVKKAAPEASPEAAPEVTLKAVPTTGKMPYSTTEKTALRKRIQNLREREGKNLRQIADLLNYNKIKTLSGQGTWTAEKVRQFLLRS